MMSRSQVAGTAPIGTSSLKKSTRPELRNTEIEAPWAGLGPRIESGVRGRKRTFLTLKKSVSKMMESNKGKNPVVFSVCQPPS